MIASRTDLRHHPGIIIHLATLGVRRHRQSREDSFEFTCNVRLHVALLIREVTYKGLCIHEADLDFTNREDTAHKLEEIARETVSKVVGL